MTFVKYAALAGLAFALCTPAMAADLGQPSASVPEQQAFDWTGAYIGANVGYTIGQTPASYVNSASFPFTGVNIDTDPKGFSGGLTLGVNQEISGGLVVGVEGDVDYGNVTDTIVDGAAVNTGHAPPTQTITGTTDWSGSVRGRLGFAAGNFLPYLTAGLAVANTTVSATDGNLSDSAVLTGWTAGGGIEVALSDNWSAKGEVLYTDLGTHTYFANQFWASTAHPTSTSARFGINYKF